MIPPDAVPPVDAGELLARYVLQSSHIRSSNQTVKPDAFIPHPYRDLSVTRHREATEGEIWNSGQTVAGQIGKRLHGRADVVAEVCLSQRLTVNAAPVEGNPNHANISNWPADKAAQKIIALEISAAAKFLPLS
jgi:hypothetical protein